MQRFAWALATACLSACAAPPDLPRTFAQAAGQATIIPGPADAVMLRPVTRMRRPDGRYDLVLTHSRATDSLFRWDASRPEELPVRMRAAYPTGASIQAIDVDQDGWEDLVFAGANQVLMFRGPLDPNQVGPELLFELPIEGGLIRGIGFQDLTGDGEPDWMFRLTEYAEEGLIVLPGPVIDVARAGSPPPSSTSTATAPPRSSSTPSLWAPPSWRIAPPPSSAARSPGPMRCPRGETPIRDAHGLFVGGAELGHLDGVFNVGDLDGTGRDVLAVGLPLLNAELTCPSNTPGAAGDYVQVRGTGGFALVRLDG